MYILPPNKTKHFLNFGFIKIKQSILIGIALLVAFLISLPRVLTLFNIVKDFGDTFNHASTKDIIVRFVYLASFSWLILQYYCNWRFIFYHLSKFFRTIIDVVLGIIIILATVKSLEKVYVLVVGDELKPEDVSLQYFVYIVILIILLFVSRILRYQIMHQEYLVEKEHLKQQSLNNELEALKNQINPHFLFNSLNSLNSLVRDNKQATTFVNKLSFMYRYILQNGSSDMVTVSEELKFLQSYIFLIETRYRDRFKIEINIDNNLLNEKLPALALQLLVENAVKHNEISATNPLLVKVYSEEEFLIVENKIRQRTTFVDSTGNGLANLDKRYIMLKKKHITIFNDSKTFKVKLPLN